MRASSKANKEQVKLLTGVVSGAGAQFSEKRTLEGNTELTKSVIYNLSFP